MARRGERTAATVSGAAASQPAPPADAGAAASTRERTLDVALDLFIHKGYAETSLREIAAELGFSKAALYYHFESKQDILLALHMRTHHLLMRLALQNRRLMQLHLRNQEAIAEMHLPGALQKHGAVQHAVEEHLLRLIQDPSATIDQRIR